MKDEYMTHAIYLPTTHGYPILIDIICWKGMFIKYKDERPIAHLKMILSHVSRMNIWRASFFYSALIRFSFQSWLLLLIKKKKNWILQHLSSLFIPLPSTSTIPSICPFGLSLSTSTHHIFVCLPMFLIICSLTSSY